MNEALANVRRSRPARDTFVTGTVPDSGAGARARRDTFVTGTVPGAVTQGHLV